VTKLANTTRKHKLTKGGEKTREKIIDAAKVVLMEHGFVKFSTPRVAKQAKMSQGNLTYYFPNREELVLALVESLISEYSDAFWNHYQKLDTIDEHGIQAIIEWLIDDAVTDKTSRLIPELWALSNQNEQVARAMHRLYDDTAEAFAEAMGIQAHNPHRAEFMSAVYFLAATVEGATAIHVTRPQDRDQRLSLLKKCAIPLLTKEISRTLALCQQSL